MDSLSVSVWLYTAVILAPAFLSLMIISHFPTPFHSFLFFVHNVHNNIEPCGMAEKDGQSHEALSLSHNLSFYLSFCLSLALTHIILLGPRSLPEPGGPAGGEGGQLEGARGEAHPSEALRRQDHSGRLHREAIIFVSEQTLYLPCQMEGIFPM